MAERDTIQFNYKPKIYAVAQEVIAREVAAVLDLVKGASIEAALYEYYQNVYDAIYSAFARVFNSYQQSIATATINELGGRPWVDKFDPTGMLDSFIETFKNDYTDRYTRRHIRSSFGQLNALVEQGADAIVERLEQWRERRPEKISRNEATRANQSMFQMIAWYAGFATVWRTRGKTCPYCMKLDGKRIYKGQSFLDAGDVLDPADGEHAPMHIYSKIQHCPAHFSCDCFLSI